MTLAASFQQLVSTPLKNNLYINIYTACEEGRSEDVVKFFSSPLKIMGEPDYLEWQNPDKAKRTFLFCSSREGHVKIVQLLLDMGANVETPNENGATPLLVASQNGHFEVVKLLLKSNANVNATNKDGKTPLYSASQNGHVDVVQLLLESHANVDIPIKGGITPLLIASHEGYIDVIKLLLKSKANVDAADEYGRTPLSIATKVGHTDVVEFLLESKANPDTSDKYGRTPLFLASQKGQSDMVQLLLNSKTNINTITRKIKCRFETDIVKIPCKKTTTFQEFITMVEDEWGGEKGIRYRDEEGDMVTMKRTEELVWVWEKSGSESVRVEVFSKGSQGPSTSDYIQHITNLEAQLEASKKTILTLQAQLEESTKERQSLQIASLRARLEYAKIINTIPQQQQQQQQQQHQQHQHHQHHHQQQQHQHHQQQHLSFESDSAQQIAALRAELEAAREANSLSQQTSILRMELDSTREELYSFERSISSTQEQQEQQHEQYLSILKAQLQAMTLSSKLEELEKDLIEKEQQNCSFRGGNEIGVDSLSQVEELVKMLGELKEKKEEVEREMVVWGGGEEN